MTKDDIKLEFDITFQENFGEMTKCDFVQYEWHQYLDALKRNNQISKEDYDDIILDWTDATLEEYQIEEEIPDFINDIISNFKQD